jgi:iron complex transport system substrate-binding protein
MRRVTKYCIILFLLTGFLLSACNRQQVDAPLQTETQQTDAATEQSEAAVSQTRVFTDLQGNDVELPLEVKRVIHLWPASTALHVFLGTGDKIYGTLAGVQRGGWGWLTTACPRLLEIDGFAGDAAAEELLNLEPDVVITSNKDLAANLRAQGVPAVCMLAGEDMDSLKEMILKMGELLGSQETAKAEEYVAYLDDVLDTVVKATASIPEDRRVRLYYNSAQMGDSPLLTCGEGSIVQSWMDAAGCVNVVKDVIQGMDKEVNMEVIVEADPDFILIGGINQEKTLNDILNDPAWQNLTAVKEGRIIRNPQGVMKWEKFGVEIALQMLWFTEQMYPDALDIDIEPAVKDFYLNYYGYELSDQNYKDLLDGFSAPQ